MLFSLQKKFKFASGFTMIELLVVIAILGVLAVVVLGAINPLEQINRGRDTSSQSDSENLHGAIERYSANIGRFPWMATGADEDEISPITQISDAAPEHIVGCSILEILGQGDPAVLGCNGTQEIKSAMVERVGSEATSRGHYLYYRGIETGDSVYVCFSPQSNAFRQRAQEQCEDWDTTGPADVDWVILGPEVCPATGNNNAAGEPRPMICL